MRLATLPYLRCPLDGTELEIVIDQQDDDGHVITGKLTSQSGNVYPIDHGVPNLLPPADQEKFGDALRELSRQTTAHFGYEWNHFNRFGWLEDYPCVDNMEELYLGALIEHSRSAFWHKTLFEDNDLKPHHTVLDAGCGNGRHINIARQSGCTIVGIDLGPAVYTAFENTRHMENIHIVRGNLLQLPFSQNIFDRIYSIGVLMHTGSAEKAFNNLAKTLKDDGMFAITVYGVGRKGYEILDALIRGMVLRMPRKLQLQFSDTFSGFVRWLKVGGSRRQRAYNILRQYVRMMPTKIHNYDWWAAPIATHHTLDEVVEWYTRNGLQVIASTPEIGNMQQFYAYRKYNASITAKGIKNRTDHNLEN